MLLDPNVFYRNVTKALCSSLDVEVSLSECFAYLRSIFPVDKIVFAFYDQKSIAIKHVVSVGDSGADSTGRSIALPAEVGALLAKGGIDSDRLISDTQLDPLCAAVAPYVNNQGCSEIILSLGSIEGEPAYVVVQAQGIDVYTQEHVELLISVRESMIMALNNAHRHQQLVLLKDQLEDDNQHLQKELERVTKSDIIGSEAGLDHVMEMISQVAPLKSTVLLLGETGVGKEVIANELHRLSSRRKGPFIKVNCGAIPEDLVDSELFGHEKGAFSGAIAQKRGRFERADGGTIFLDEIGELPHAAQVRLLRVLQSREIERVGGTKSIPVDIRVIAATHRNLEKMVADGLFREDLWFRINAFPVTIPPLRQRREDIPALIDYFIEAKSKEFGYREPPPIASGALEMLIAYPWPGNVRELENVVERALIQNRGRALTLDSFTFSKHPNGPMAALSDSCGCVFPCLVKGESQSSGSAGESFPPLTLEELTSQHIQKVLDMTEGKVNGEGGAAELLGINPSTLRNRMKKQGIPYGRRSVA